jgi:molybdate transport system substrate-binding protein
VKKFLIALLLLLAAFPSPAPAGKISAAAASDLKFVFTELAARFQKDTGHLLTLSFGSSGNFFAQIQNGAPFDLFFSADIEYPRRLEAAGLAEPGTLYSYAAGKIVLWVPANSKLDVSKGLSVLLDPGVRKIAIANPQHAPYGRAAMAALQHEKLYEKLRNKFVLGENVSQAAQFVESGNADAGILALSLVLAPAMKDRGRYFEIPQSVYPPIEQAAVILKSSRNKPAARQFLEYLKKPESIALLKDCGLALPESRR